MGSTLDTSSVLKAIQGQDEGSLWSVPDDAWCSAALERLTLFSPSEETECLQFQ